MATFYRGNMLERDAISTYLNDGLIGEFLVHNHTDMPHHYARIPRHIWPVKVGFLPIVHCPVVRRFDQIRFLGSWKNKILSQHLVARICHSNPRFLGAAEALASLSGAHCAAIGAYRPIWITIGARLVGCRPLGEGEGNSFVANLIVRKRIPRPNPEKLNED